MEGVFEVVQKGSILSFPDTLEEKGGGVVKDWYYGIGAATGIISMVLLVYTMGWTLGTLQTKTNILWENYQTRTNLYEKLFIEIATERMNKPKSPEKYISYLSDSFVSEMKTDKIKKVLDSNLPLKNKVFSIIDKIGGLDNLTKLLDTESSMDALGVLACLVENYPPFPK